MLICEGIAQYFELRTMGDASSAKLYAKEFSDYVSKLDYNAYYKVGYSIVKPILDKDIDEGIEFLTKNPPKDGELSNIIAYKERILREFEKIRTNKN